MKKLYDKKGRTLIIVAMVLATIISLILSALTNNLNYDMRKYLPSDSNTKMSLEVLKDEFGEELVFFGGICVQDLLPNGTPDKIKAEVIRRAEILGKDGGYIVAPAHNIQEDTPMENIIALFDAVKGLWL